MYNHIIVIIIILYLQIIFVCTFYLIFIKVFHEKQSRYENQTEKTSLWVLTMLSHYKFRDDKLVLVMYKCYIILVKPNVCSPTRNDDR